MPPHDTSALQSLLDGITAYIGAILVSNVPESLYEKSPNRRQKWLATGAGKDELFGHRYCHFFGVKNGNDAAEKTDAVTNRRGIFGGLQRIQEGAVNATGSLTRCGMPYTDAQAFERRVVDWAESGSQLVYPGGHPTEAMQIVDDDALMKWSADGALLQRELNRFLSGPAGDEPKTKATQRTSKRRRTIYAKPLTPTQSRALELYGECNGRICEIARRMGVKHPTVNQHLKAAWRKLPELAPKNTKASKKRTTLPADKKGQVAIAENRRLR